MPRKATTAKKPIKSKKGKAFDLSDSDNDNDNDTELSGGDSSDSESIISDKSDLSEISDASDDDSLVDSLASDSDDNITEEDLSDDNNTDDESDISDTDASNPRNIIKDDEGCVHDYIGSEDDALDELETDKVKVHDLSALEYFKDYDPEDTSIKYLTGENRVTKPYLFDYERIHLLSVRTKQIASGAKSLIKDSIEMPAYVVSELELKHKVLPLILERPLPNGLGELWKMSELKQLN